MAHQTVRGRERIGDRTVCLPAGGPELWGCSGWPAGEQLRNPGPGGLSVFAARLAHRRGWAPRNQGKKIRTEHGGGIGGAHGLLAGYPVGQRGRGPETPDDGGRNTGMIYFLGKVLSCPPVLR